MKRLIHLAAPLAAVLLLSACASSINSDVTRFHRLAAPSGETFRVVASDSNKTGSLEFDTYARQVSDQLARVGLRPADAAATPTLEVKLDYAISGGKEKIASRPGSYSLGLSSYWNSGFYGRRGRHGGYYPYFAGYDPFWDYGFREPEIYSYTVYTRSLKMDIAKTGSNEKLFEGRAESIGSDNRLPEVMPYLVQAMFTGFPGNSGITQRVKIDVKRN
jgi:Domain of unknown function (DUF4136)